MNRMHMARGLTAALAVIGVLGVRLQSAHAEESVTVTTNTTGGVTTFTVVVSGLEGERKWKDLHIFSGAQYKFPKIEGSNPENTTVTNSGDSSTQSWNVERSDGGKSVHIATGTASGSPAGYGNGTYTFPINFADDTKSSNHAITWKVTDDGNLSVPGASHIIDDDGGQLAGAPQLTMTANSDNPLTTYTGAAAGVLCTTETGFENDSYAIYTSRSLCSDYSDTLHIGINSATDPVPGTWYSSFSNFTGTIASNGNPTYTPSITTPANPALVGNTYYLVFALLDGSSNVKYSSRPIQVVIAAP